MTIEEKIEWMNQWCEKQGLTLELNGECGFGRESVGVSAGGNYPDYEWYNDDFDEVSGNGEVWTPEDSYHKHPCVAVLGHGEGSTSQLYDWLKWFDENGFKYQTAPRFNRHQVEALMHGTKYHRMVKSD